MPRTESKSTGNLPLELTSFIGRKRELSEVRRLLVESRLVTLTGVGGTGKTRLALQAAGHLRRAFPGGAWFVDLTALREPKSLILDAQNLDVLAYMVMVALGMREQPGAGTPMEQLVRSLADRQALLVLDNCEHLVEVCAVFADTMLRGCPELRIVATSREPLRVAGEVLFAVPPLPAPGAGHRASPSDAVRFESMALFVARALAVAPDFAVDENNVEAVAELCRRLDGLPLAIELASARVRALSPWQILDGLGERFAMLSRGRRNAPARQQTLRASVEWSFDLCDKPEQLLWARLSVFVGGCELEAIEGTCADERLRADELLDVVTELVDKSILVSEVAGRVTRYRMLETLRDYGQRKLVDVGERELSCHRHRDWYTDLVRRFEADVISPRQAEWFARLDRELPNIRAALQYSLADPEGAEAGLTVAAGLLLYWGVRGLHSEARSWVYQALARPTGASMTRIKALHANVTLTGLPGDLSAASEHVREGHQVAAQLGDARGHAIMACAEGVLGMVAGDLVQATRAWQKGVDGLAGEQSGEFLRWRLNSLTGLAMTKGMLGEADGAAARYQLVVEICERNGESWFLGCALYALGLLLWKRGDTTTAAARLREGVQRLRPANDTLATVWCLEVLALIAYDDGRSERAATLLGVTTRLAHAAGVRPALFPELAVHHQRYEQRARAALGEQAYQAAFAHGERLTVDEAVAYALDEAPAGSATAPAAASTPLTRREQQVANLIAQGLSNKEIAAKLVISQRTAESHVEHILTKLGFANRTQVAAWATQGAGSGQDS